MPEKIRVTIHNGRKSKDGVYNPNHNDRNFNYEDDSHIDATKTKNNLYWNRFDGYYYEADKIKNNVMSFSDSEQKFYAKHFSKHLNFVNDKSIKQRHPERVKTIEEYRAGKNSCPEESLFYLGDKDNHVDVKILHKIVTEHLQWEIDTFPNIKVLNFALHVDEKGAPHIHKRSVFIAKNDKSGERYVNQKKALQEMNIQRPDMNKKEDRFNNAKVTYTDMCRKHLIELCQEYGLDIEVIPKEPGKSGMGLLEYQAQQAKEELEKAIKEKEQAQEQIKTEKKKLNAKENKLNERESKLDARESALNDRENDLNNKIIEYTPKLKKLENKENKLNERESGLDDRENDLNNENNIIKKKWSDYLQTREALYSNIELYEIYDKKMKNVFHTVYEAIPYIISGNAHFKNKLVPIYNELSKKLEFIDTFKTDVTNIKKNVVGNEQLFNVPDFDCDDDNELDL